MPETSGLSNIKNSFLVLLLIVSVVVLSYGFYIRGDLITAFLFNTTASANLLNKVTSPKGSTKLGSGQTDFHPVNGDGLNSFWNVCVEAVSNGSQARKIVVYNSLNRTGEHNLNVSGFRTSSGGSNNWIVYFKKESIPVSHVVVQSTAFFVIPTCTNHFQQFWNDEFGGLLTAVKNTNRIHRGITNQIIFHPPSDLAQVGSFRQCYNKTRFTEMLKTLYAEKIYESLTHVKSGTCFVNAVFGVPTSSSSNPPRMSVDHVLEYFDVPHVDGTLLALTIVQRNWRQIINLDDLLLSIHDIGFRKARIQNFQKLSADAQIRVAAMSNVMIGVQGGALQWSIFMAPGSTVIEIAWPGHHWGFFYENFAKVHGLKYFALASEKVDINWAAYEKLVEDGHPLPADERQRLEKTPPRNSTFDHDLWKYADVHVDLQRLQDIMAKLLAN